MYAVAAQPHMQVTYVLVVMRNHKRKVATGRVGHRSDWTVESFTSLSLSGCKCESQLNQEHSMITGGQVYAQCGDDDGQMNMLLPNIAACTTICMTGVQTQCRHNSLPKLATHQVALRFVGAGDV